MTGSTAEGILTAVEEILTSEGIEGVSIRNVAKRAGVSIGAVQHHHHTKDDLLMAAMDEVGRRFIERVMAATDLAATPLANLAAVSRILGGVDDESRIASVVWLAFASKAATSEAVARAHRDAWLTMERGLTTLLQQVNPLLGENDAAALMALLDGIAIARATETERMTATRAGDIIGAFLDRFKA
ncbi:TetR/AcrR family transcriptional regulator [Clavibacter zhangzhiyongii]|uniref:TetR/AcrR family transcriptional regulator n=1 Tax=Clavibacter zhangzhiyongii TaxID=2768071 RepID=A0A7L7Z2W1_9MICO|nr:TetR/AcrR family transcriptional regulator [Clavibacter zhangzhiyongii]QOD44084.1 TetR/AcrR family transcriptional regulator [Clavibacter zhangzhiyongii]